MFAADVEPVTLHTVAARASRSATLVIVEFIGTNTRWCAMK